MTFMMPIDGKRDVAQLVSVHVWGACGRQFESGHPDEKKFLSFKKIRHLPD